MKPTAPVTLPVAARVDPVVKQQLVARAGEAGISLCEYTSLLLTQAVLADEVSATSSAKLERENATLLQRQKETDDQLLAVQKHWQWAEDPLTCLQLSEVAANIACSHQLHQTFGQQPIDLAAAKRAGLKVAYLLMSARHDEVAWHSVGPYSWRYYDAKRTQIMVIPTPVPSNARS